jgi:DNA polymerase III epsilon subunit family exonuclease
MSKNNYIQGSDGKMKGSKPNPVAPSLIEPLTSPTRVEEETEEVSLLMYMEMKEKVDQVTRQPWQTNDPRDPIHVKKLSETIFHKNPPPLQDAYADHKEIVFDEAQKKFLMMSQIGRSQRKLERDGIDLFQQVEAEEWSNWCNEQSAIWEEKGELVLAANYKKFGEEKPPTQVEFHVYQKLPYQISSAHKSLDREMRYLAGYHDISVSDAEEAFLQARKEYIDSKQKIEVPEWYLSAVSGSYIGGDAIKKPPLDKATAYALYAVLSDESRTQKYEKKNNGYIVFDTETTGLQYNSEIIQITAVEYDSQGKEINRISTYVNPGPNEEGIIYTGDEKAVEIHGITVDTVKDAPKFDEIAPSLHEMMQGKTLIGHNVMFDYPKVQRALSKSNHPIIDSGPMIDTLRLARYTQPNPGVPTKEWRYNLETACKRAGLDFNAEEAHDAAYDVDRTSLLYRTLKKLPLGGK